MIKVKRILLRLHKADGVSFIRCSRSVSTLMPCITSHIYVKTPMFAKVLFV